MAVASPAAAAAEFDEGAPLSPAGSEDDEYGDDMFEDASDMDDLLAEFDDVDFGGEVEGFL